MTTLGVRFFVGPKRTANDQVSDCWMLVAQMRRGDGRCSCADEVVPLGMVEDLLRTFLDVAERRAED